MVQINWTNLAVEDLKGIHDYISRDSKKDLLIKEILSSEVMVKLSNLLNEKINFDFSILEKNNFGLDFNNKFVLRQKS